MEHKRKRVINDFGGAGKRRIRRKTDGGDLLSLRCISCNKLNYLNYLQTQRAARPRCNACGGGLAEIETSFKRRTGKTYKGAVRDIESNVNKPYACSTCKKRFRTTIALELHVKEQHNAAPPSMAEVRQQFDDNALFRLRGGKK
jgi:DNA-directed RNA polymerase subunit RPC12/RpoP